MRFILALIMMTATAYGQSEPRKILTRGGGGKPIQFSLDGKLWDDPVTFADKIGGQNMEPFNLSELNLIYLNAQKEKLKVMQGAKDRLTEKYNETEFAKTFGKSANPADEEREVDDYVVKAGLKRKADDARDQMNRLKDRVTEILSRSTDSNLTRGCSNPNEVSTVSTFLDRVISEELEEEVGRLIQKNLTPEEKIYVKTKYGGKVLGDEIEIYSKLIVNPDGLTTSSGIENDPKLPKLADFMKRLSSEDRAAVEGFIKSRELALAYSGDLEKIDELYQKKTRELISKYGKSPNPTAMAAELKKEGFNLSPSDLTLLSSVIKAEQQAYDEYKGAELTIDLFEEKFRELKSTLYPAFEEYHAAIDPLYSPGFVRLSQHIQNRENRPTEIKANLVNSTRTVWDGIQFPENEAKEKLEFKLGEHFNLVKDPKGKGDHKYITPSAFISFYPEKVAKLAFKSQVELLTQLDKQKSSLDSRYPSVASQLIALQKKIDEDADFANENTMGSLDETSKSVELKAQALRAYMAKKTGNPAWNETDREQLTQQAIGKLGLVQKTREELKAEEAKPDVPEFLPSLVSNGGDHLEYKTQMRKNPNFDPKIHRSQAKIDELKQKLKDANQNLIQTSLSASTTIWDVSDDFELNKAEIAKVVGSDRMEKIASADRRAKEAEDRKELTYSNGNQKEASYQDGSEKIKAFSPEYADYKTEKDVFSNSNQDPFQVLYRNLNYPKEWKALAQELGKKIPEHLKSHPESVKALTSTATGTASDAEKKTILENQIAETYALYREVFQKALGIQIESKPPTVAFENSLPEGHLVNYDRNKNMISFRTSTLEKRFKEDADATYHETLHAFMNQVFGENSAVPKEPAWVSDMRKLIEVNGRNFSVPKHGISSLTEASPEMQSYSNQPIEHVPNQLNGILLDFLSKPK